MKTLINKRQVKKYFNIHGKQIKKSSIPVIEKIFSTLLARAIESAQDKKRIGDDNFKFIKIKVEF